MGVINRIRGRDTSQLNAAAINPGLVDVAADEKIAGQPQDVPASDSDALSVEARAAKEVEAHPDQITADASAGVQKAEAAAMVWSKKAVYAVYAWIWVCYFMLAFQSAVGNNLFFTAYSDFENAPAITTANILAVIIGGVIKLPIGKILTIWGRAEGLFIFVAVYILGIIILAACTGPNSYAAGYVLYWIGYDAIYLILDVFIADTSGLQNRAFAFGFSSTPFICTAFTGSLAASSFIKTSGWRWGYGAFAIIMPCVFLPLAIVFKLYQRKAEKMGIYKREPSGRTLAQSIVHYFIEFDIIGALLLMAAFILFLLPFSLESYFRITYQSAAFIVMVILGILLFPVFAIWEAYYAPKQFIRWELFKSRTVLGACVLSAVLYFSFYCWDNYYYYFVMVVYDLDVTYTGYMTEIYNVGSCFVGPVFGLYIRYTKHFKNACLYFALPLMALGAGLMIHFRGQDGSINYVIMCQIFIAFAGGILVIGEDMAVMAASDRMNIPMMLSLIGLSSSLGGSIGYAVAAAIYADTFPKALLSRLPEDAKANATAIYLGGYLTQLEYPVGSPVREAIDYAWGYNQKFGCVAATCVLAIGFPAAAAWKNYRVDRPQNKGTVF